MSLTGSNVDGGRGNSNNVDDDDGTPPAPAAVAYKNKNTHKTVINHNNNNNNGNNRNPYFSESDKLDVYKSADELILAGKQMATDVLMDDSSGTSPPALEDISANQANLDEAINTLFHNGDESQSYGEKMNLVKVILREAVNIGMGKVAGVPDTVATAVTAIYYPGNKIHSPEGQNDKNILREQFVFVLSVAIGVYIALNWWYLIHFTSFSFSFMSWVKWAPDGLRTVLESALYFPELVNYWVLTSRVDGALSAPIKSLYCMLWDWRPITFVLWCSIFVGLANRFNLVGGFASVLSGDNGMFTGLTIAFGIVYYAMNTFFDKCALEIVMKIFGIVVGAIILLLGLILVLPLSALTAGIIALYLAFFSFFTLPFFGGTQMFAYMADIFRDLRSAPVQKLNPDGLFDKIKNFVFHHFTTLFFGFFVVSFFLRNIVASFTKVNDQSMKITMAIANIFLLISFGVSLLWTNPVRQDVGEMAGKGANLSRKLAEMMKPNTKDSENENEGDGEGQQGEEAPKKGIFGSFRDIIKAKDDFLKENPDAIAYGKSQINEFLKQNPDAAKNPFQFGKKMFGKANEFLKANPEAMKNPVQFAQDAMANPEKYSKVFEEFTNTNTNTNSNQNQ